MMVADDGLSNQTIYGCFLADKHGGLVYGPLQFSMPAGRLFKSSKYAQGKYGISVNMQEFR